MGKEKKTIYYGAMLLAVFFWASLFVFSKQVIAVTGPNTLAFFRVLVAALVLYPFAHAKGFRIKQVFTKRNLLYAFTGCFGHYLFLNLAVARCTAGVSSVLQAFIPLLGLIFGHLILQEHTPMKKAIGAVVSIIGAVLVFVESLMGEGGTTWQGILLMLMSLAFWCFYCAYSKKHSAGESSMILTVTILIGGSIFLSPFMAMEISSFWPMEFTPFLIISFLYLGIIGTAITILLWNFGLKKVDSGIAGIMMNLVPVLGVLFAALAGESLTPLQMAGCIVVVLGILVSVQGEKKQL